MSSVFTSLKFKMLTDTDVEDHYSPSVRTLEINKQDANSCGFHLTRGKWDPYPWISGVDTGTAAFLAGLKPGDCLLEVNGEDIVGQRISEVAQLVKARHQVSLLLWNAGVDPQCSPEALCCGPMPNNLQRLSACLSSILVFLECPVCLDTTAPPSYQCDNGHLICMRCRAKSERCPVCRIRFNRGRSLLADQVYNALTDAFDLREDTHESRTAKMQQIFKLKNKNKNVPGIKVTQAHTNKFLARLIGKASSVDNLSSKNNARNFNLTVDNEFNTNLKTKSLSSSEIFNSASPSISRTGSINGLNRTNIKQLDNRPMSYHGSFESLDRKIGELSNQLSNSLSSLPQSSYDDGILYHCPYKQYCSTLIKGVDIINHFRAFHDGPLIQYFKQKIQISFKNIQSDSFIQIIEDNVFFLKILEEDKMKTASSKYEDTRIWVWFLGNKKQSIDFQLHINLCDKSRGNSLLSVRSAIYSLSSVSWQDVKDSKKGVFISSQTLNAICTEDCVLEIEILKCDTQM